MLNNLKRIIATRWIKHITDARLNAEKEQRDWNNLHKELTNSMIETFYNSMKDEDRKEQ